MKLLLTFLVASIFVIAKGKRYPCWPNEFKWSFIGKIPGYQCVSFNEVAEPVLYHFYDNYLCAKSGPEYHNISWEFSMIGAKTGMKCVNTYEHSDPHFWYDNHLCVPQNSPYNFTWSSAGCISGKYCLQIVEPSAPEAHTWNDNYLCHQSYGACTNSSFLTAARNETYCNAGEKLTSSLFWIIPMTLLKYLLP